MGRPVSRYCAVLLDALGTLVQLEPPWPRLRTILASRHGIEVPEDEARQAMLAEMSFYREHHLEGADAESVAVLRARCALVLRDRLPAVAELGERELTEALLDCLRFVPYEDAAPALAALRQAGLRLAVVSNWDCSLGAVLSQLGLGGAFDAVVVSAEVGVPKPNPEIFRAALDELRCDAEDSLFAGDSLETDVEGARAAGIRAFLLDRSEGGGGGPAVERIFSLHDLVELAVTAPSVDRSR